MKLYLPNPQQWVDFFERGQLTQRGAGSRARVIAVERSKPVSLNTVLPAEQTTAQAKSELEREGINPKAIEKAVQSGTGRRSGNKSTGTSGKRKTRDKSSKAKIKKPRQDIFEIS